MNRAPRLYDPGDDATAAVTRRVLAAIDSALARDLVDPDDVAHMLARHAQWLAATNAPARACAAA